MNVKVVPLVAGNVRGNFKGAAIVRFHYHVSNPVCKKARSLEIVLVVIAVINSILPHNHISMMIAVSKDFMVTQVKDYIARNLPARFRSNFRFHSGQFTCVGIFRFLTQGGFQHCHISQKSTVILTGHRFLESRIGTFSRSETNLVVFHQQAILHKLIFTLDKKTYVI